MKYHRFIGDFDLNQKEISVVDEEVLSQWRNVLRFKTGTEIILCDGAGNESTATIESIEKNKAVVSIHSKEHIVRGTSKIVTLYLAILKRENFELVVQKATELGVTNIRPLISTRTVKTGFNKQRMEKIILEASEQSGRTTVPQIHEPEDFESALGSVTKKGTVVFDGTGNMMTDTDFASHELNIFIGPEGGWDPRELELAQEKEIRICAIGDLTLRGETAAIVATYLACSCI